MRRSKRRLTMAAQPIGALAQSAEGKEVEASNTGGRLTRCRLQSTHDFVGCRIKQQPAVTTDLASERAHGITDAAAERKLRQRRWRGRTRETNDNRTIDAACAEFAQEVEDRRGLEAELRDDVDVDTAGAAPVAPVAKRFEACCLVEIGMTLGVSGDADAANAVRLQEPAVSNVAARLERSARGRDIARDQEHAPDVGLAAETGEKIVEHLARGNF